MQNRNSLRLIAAAIVALLVAYLRMTGYLPESGQEASYEDQAEAESEYEAPSEVHTAEGNGQQQSSLLIRDGFCRTTYEVFVMDSSRAACLSGTGSAERPTRSSSTPSVTVTETGSAICRDFSQGWIISMTATLQGVRISG